MDKFLMEHKITAYRLSKETEGLVNRGSVYTMARSTEVKRLDLDNLEHLLAALSALTGKVVSVGDLFTGAPEPVSLRRSAAGAVYTDDAETNDVLDDHPDILERLEKFRRSQGLDV